MSSGAKSLAGVFGMTDRMIPMVLDDLTDEQLYARPRGEGAPSIAWAVGHLTFYRGFMLERLGRPDPHGERLGPLFASTAASDGSDYPSLAELRGLWGEVAEAFSAALTGVGEDALDATVEGGLHADQTLRDLIAFFAWHEGYHLGAIGQIRKELGLPGPAERMAAMRRAQREAGAP